MVKEPTKKDLFKEYLDSVEGIIEGWPRWKRELSKRILRSATEEEEREGTLRGEDL